jgi:NAD-dependent SIR2 family protein deacetylase
VKRRRRNKKRDASPDEGAYVCPTCGETIVIPLDRSGGDEQRYVEDCPVCCNPNVVIFDEGEPPRVWAEAE